MDLFNNKQQKAQAMSAKNTQAFQNSLNEAEQALTGDPLQEAVKQKKNEQR